MKKILLVNLAIGLLVVGGVGSANASIVDSVTLDFQSGAVWTGTITFNDGYQGMISTDGYLNGGSNSWANDYFSWTWWNGTNQTNPQNDTGIVGVYNDWLMDGTPSSWSNYIGLTWDPAASTIDGSVDFVLGGDTNYSGIDSTDSLVSYNNSSPVPEPATMLLLGTGLAGLVAVRRKKTA